MAGGLDSATEDRDLVDEPFHPHVTIARPSARSSPIARILDQPGLFLARREIEGQRDLASDDCHRWLVVRDRHRTAVGASEFDTRLWLHHRLGLRPSMRRRVRPLRIKRLIGKDAIAKLNQFGACDFFPFLAREGDFPPASPHLRS
jgi:hypothetical protein